MKYITKTAITNRSDFNTIKREVLLTSHILDAESESITMKTCVNYYDANDVDITNKFAPNRPTLVATNFQRKTLYELDGVTPQTEIVNEQEIIDGVVQYNQDGTPKMVDIVKEKTIGMYDYLIAMIQQPVILNTLYIQYIQINDIKGNFNKTE